ncbi:MAG: RNA 2',3'-cyclic phosphodiesterase [Alphaproteobacteria bacterium]|nr:RNA 2',3'-cyclic phosphodiesterase [Alphaproteobacteria bacterium]
MIRLFVGLALPQEVRQRLSFLTGGVPGARWDPPENYHITLRFIGEVEMGQAEDIDAELQRIQVPEFAVTLASVDHFGPPEKARVLYAGVERSELLLRLQGKVENGVQRAGLPPEQRKFVPHVTLARLKDAPVQRILAFRESHSLFRAGPVPVGEFALYSSHPGKGHSVYREEATYPLGGG